MEGAPGTPARSRNLLPARGWINAGVKGARPQPIARRAAAKAASSMGSVRRPVKVFCWLG